MPAKPKKKPGSLDIPEELESIYYRYLADFLPIASKIDTESPHVDLEILNSSGALMQYAVFSDVIADVVIDAYIKNLKRLPLTELLSIMAIIDELAETKAEGYFPYPDGTVVYTVEPSEFLTCELIEEAVEQSKAEEQRKIAFVYYYALAIMQFSLLIPEIRSKQYDLYKTARFVDIQKSLGHARYAYAMLRRSAKSDDISSHKEVARKGGQIRAARLYGAAREYTVRRYKELLAEKPSTSKRQAAKTITEEAYEQAIFKPLSKDNLFDTIYRWLREI